VKQFRFVVYFRKPLALES